jgi:hypothetical protein
MSSNKALVAALISFFLPGFGLFLSKQNKIKGLLIFIIAVIADVISIVIGLIFTLCLFGVLFFAAPLVIHILAAVHTHDVIVKEDKSGKPILFN